jgi:hypothetical protein
MAAAGLWCCSGGARVWVRCTVMRSWAGVGAGPRTALLLGWLALGQKGEAGWAREARNRLRQAGSGRREIGRGRLVKWAKQGKEEKEKSKRAAGDWAQERFRKF